MKSRYSKSKQSKKQMKRSRVRSKKVSKKVKRSKSRSPRNTKSRCQNFLRKKIRTNMQEYKDGLFSSRAQAIAVSYSQTKKKLPYCSRYFKRK